MINKNKYLNELIRQLKRLGYRCKSSDNPKHHCNIYNRNKKLCTIFKNSALLFCMKFLLCMIFLVSINTCRSKPDRLDYCQEINLVKKAIDVLLSKKQMGIRYILFETAAILFKILRCDNLLFFWFVSE